MSPGAPDKLRIAQVVASRAWGGVERAPLLLARGLRDLGHDVRVWADPKAPAGEEARRLGIPLHPLRWGGYLSPGGILQTLKGLKDPAPQVLHLHHSRDLWTVTPALRLSKWGGALFLTKHVGSSVGKKDPLHAWLYGRVDRLFTCSSVIRRNVVSTCPVPEAKVAVSYAPVDLDLFRFDPEGRRVQRNRWEVLEGRPVIGMAARLTPGKGHETLLKAAAILKMDFPNALFKVAGDCSPDQAGYKADLLEERDGLGLRKQFEFVGYVPEMPAFLSALDIAVHPAKAEAFGLAAVEALACGRPLVGRAGEGLDEILLPAAEGPRGGVLVPSDDPAEWAAAIGHLLKDRGLYLKLARKSRAAAEPFSLKNLAKKHEEWYLEVLRSKGILAGQ